MAANTDSMNLNAQRDITIGELVGRDKIVNNIQNIVQRALTAAEAASGERALETQLLAQGVSAFAQRLQAIASDTGQGKATSPYKGLLAYGLSDAEIFFGRSQAIASLLKRLGRGSFAVHPDLQEGAVNGTTETLKGTEGADPVASALSVLQ